MVLNKNIKEKGYYKGVYQKFLKEIKSKNLSFAQLLKILYSGGITKREKSIIYLLFKNVGSTFGGKFLDVGDSTFLSKKGIVKDYCIFELFYNNYKKKIIKESKKILWKKGWTKGTLYKVFEYICRSPLRPSYSYKNNLQLTDGSIRYYAYIAMKKLLETNDNFWKDFVFLMSKIMFGQRRTRNYAKNIQN